MCNRKWAKQPFFHCIVLVHKSLCWQHCFLIKKFWAWDVINRNLWKEKRIYYSKWNPNCVWFVFQQTVLGNLSIFITQCHLDRNINGIPTFLLTVTSHQCCVYHCRSHVPSWGHSLPPLAAGGWETGGAVLAPLRKGMDFPLMPPPQKLGKWNFLLQSHCTQDGQGLATKIQHWKRKIRVLLFQYAVTPLHRMWQRKTDMYPSALWRPPQHRSRHWGCEHKRK